MKDHGGQPAPFETYWRMC